MPFKGFTLLAAGAVALVIATGCSKGSDHTTTSTTTTTTDTSAPAVSAPAAASTSGAGGAMANAGVMGDASHGKAIFSANCATCHGATGVEGGIGPSLKGEKNKKNYQQTIAWIHNPKPPMPKLWPSPLNDKDVADVATYVQSL